MKGYSIILKPRAIKDIDSLKKYDAKVIIDKIEEHLRYDPDLISKASIKKLRGLQESDYRLRAGDYRIFYNIEKFNYTVYVLRIMHKDETGKFYKEE